jgi:hypothetical protein
MQDSIDKYAPKHRPGYVRFDVYGLVKKRL